MCFFHYILVVEVAVRVVFGVNTTMSLCSDFQPNLFSLVYPQMGQEFNETPFPSLAAQQSADQEDLQ